MATLEIEGVRVEVGDGFLDLPPDQQQAQVEEIARSLQLKAGPDHPIMSQVNRGIADTVGGLVDIINPWDQQMGSAATGLSNVMESGGIEVAQGDPTNFVEGIARGTGDAAGTILPVAKVAQALSHAPGLVGRVSGQIAAPMATTGGTFAEVGAGAASGGAMQVAEEMGAPEWAQQVVGMAAPLSIPAAGATARAAGRASPVGRLVRGVKANLAPYSEGGAYEVARQRLQSLAGGPERAEELAGRIDPAQDGVTPAQQTQDPNMLAVERRAMSEDPNIRSRIEAEQAATQDRLSEEFRRMGGDPAAATTWIERRRRDFLGALKSRVDAAMTRADERLNEAGPQQSETGNSRALFEEVTLALNEAVGVEARLWDAVPRGAMVGTAEARSAAARLIEATPRAQSGDVPDVVRRLLGEGGFSGRESVNEMYGLYSELRRVARSSMAGNDQNKNRARIANEIADAILKDLGATTPDSEIGRAINEARTYSAGLHATFDRGAPGRILQRTLDGDQQINPGVAMSRTVGRGGAAGAVSVDELTAAGGPGVREPIEDFLREQLLASARAGDGTFTNRTAQTFMRRNQELLGRFPELKAEIEGAVGDRLMADRMASRMTDLMSRVQSTTRSTTARFTDAPPERAIQSIFQGSNPTREIRVLAATARKDPSGQALEGLKGALSDYILNNVTSLRGGQSEINPDQLMAMLTPGTGRMGDALTSVFGKDEIGRMRHIARLVSQSSGNGVSAPSLDSLSGARPNRIIEYMARIVAARTGADMGGGGGGSLQTAQMASSRMRDLLGRLASDKASQLLADAVEDPDLFRALLTDMRSVDAEQVIMSRVVPYIVGGASATVAETAR